jgi:toxin ParE1/3/4
MPYTVRLSEGAERDLKELHEYLRRHDSPESADYVLERIEQVFASLAQTPDRGNWPPELLALGIREFREVFFKPYRIFYLVDGKSVNVILIADGRRNMRPLLQRRLLMVAT